jgi:hypothetical protein
MMPTKEIPRLVLNDHAGEPLAAWIKDVAESDSFVQPLIVECVGNNSKPVCPVCLEGAEQDEHQGRSGLVVCSMCLAPYIVLHLLGGPNGSQWLSFPWAH